MNFNTEENLKKQAEEYFNSIPPNKRAEIEIMYSAFRARLMYELRISGGSNQGVVYGHLEKR
jgi:hypothetical protein